MVFFRCSKADVIGGHTNFMQNHTNIAKEIACPINVKLIFKFRSLLK